MSLSKGTSSGGGSGLKLFPPESNVVKAASKLAGKSSVLHVGAIFARADKDALINVGNPPTPRHRRQKRPNLDPRVRLYCTQAFVLTQ